MFVESHLRELRSRNYTPKAVGAYVVACARTSFQAALGRPRALAWVLLAGFLHVVLLLGVSLFLSFRIDRALAFEFFLFTMLWLLIGLAWITAHLGMFRTDDELPWSGLGLPNFLTLGRLLAVPAFYLFMVNGVENYALAAFLVGGLSDVADGMAARALNASTRMGRIFDPLVDVVFNAGVAVALTAAGHLPGWILGLVLLRYGLLTFGGAWIYITRGPVAVRPTVLGKTMGVISTGLLVSVLLIPRWLSPAGSEQALELVIAALGFVLALAIVQVVIIGVYNLRNAGHVPVPSGPISVVLGQDEDTSKENERGVSG